MWGYGVLIAIGLALCAVFGWAYGRWQAQQRAIRLDCATGTLDSGEWGVKITVTNGGRVTEEHVIVRIEVSVTEDAWLGAHVAQVNARGPLQLHAAEREDERITVFVYWIDWLEPRDSVVILVTASEDPVALDVVASASIESGTFIYPESRREWDG